ncbi:MULTISPECIES: hypothetical protein [Nocardiaceae]|uniref:hypothetical protein n=1 Tax=Nocardiaceae TaxID=85025 RepID=UPI0009FCA608|nr:MULTISPECIES: hypothetical protein [Nocardiaceae]MBF6102083.1 hypothetical protein [Nocardia cyriacigeorgica]MBF6162979.1 hypothetical protein [Nocardia cyriacigeorgica]MBF6201946.1 hypothetical protein [Nocardia cyriacigeorgica]MBF6320832.1 hypothetical protein [Nocardia cyriacigeorgica]MBF6518379.1 hypothetical protein [Nocardia cyriacigeorgica]
MTDPREMPDRRHSPHEHSEPAPARAGRMRRALGHRAMMVICCIPMLAIAIALVATGTVGVGALVFAGACVLMMAMMMGGPGHGGHGGHGSGR